MWVMFIERDREIGREREAGQLKTEILEERHLFPTLEQTDVGSPSAGLWLAHTLCFDSSQCWCGPGRRPWRQTWEMES